MATTFVEYEEDSSQVSVADSSDIFDISETNRSVVKNKFTPIFSSEISESIELGIYNYAHERFLENNIQPELLLEFYKQIFIKVYFNVKFNKNSQQVIDSLKNEKCDPEELAKMKREALFPDKWEQLYKNRTADLKKKRKKGQHQCRKCNSWFTSFTETQTRSADESMTISVTCDDCDNHWKIY